MRPDLTLRTTIYIVTLMAVIQFAIQISLLARGVEYIASSLVIDDTYYYLQTAWNTKQLGFVTFDGLHATNGVQLLWFVIILLLTLLVKTKIALLFATLTVVFLLNGLCYLFIVIIGAELKQPVLALFMASLWSLQSLPWRIYSMGMENSLHALVFWFLIWQSVIFLIRVQTGERPNFWGLTVALILNVWTRLDAALLSVTLFTFYIGMLVYAYRSNLKIFYESYKKVIVGCILLAGVALIAQMTAFKVIGDSFLPVSAIVKTSGTSWALEKESATKFVEVVLEGMPSILQGRFPPLVLILVAISGILLLLRAQFGRRDKPLELRAFLNLWFCLLVGELLYEFYIAVSGVKYMPYFIWYRSPAFIFWIISASLIAFFIFDHFKMAIQNSSYLRWTPVGFSLLIFAVSLYMFARSINFTSKLYTTRYHVAKWLAQNSPPDTIFASWNAGQLGYFSDRTFINLDGVINNIDYYQRVLRGSIPLTDYLSENEVDYIVDYDSYASIPDFLVVHTFPINDGSDRAIHIWQVSSEIASTP